MAVCLISPDAAQPVHLDCRRDDDFELHVRDLIQARDLRQRTTTQGVDEEAFWCEHALDRAVRGRHSYEYDKRFENTMAESYRLLECEITQDVRL
jgi:hypothetical protein